MADSKRNALYNLIFRVDRSEQRDSLRSVEQLENATEALRLGLGQVDDNTGALVEGLKRIGEGRQALQSAADKAKEAALESGTWSDELERAWKLLIEIGNKRDEVAAVGDAIGDAAVQSERLKRGVDLEGRISRFDDVSRQVSLAGDFQSNLGALRGLSGAAGLTGSAAGLDVAGELVVLTEELPRLKAALTGLPQTVAAAVGALGLGGIGLIAGIAALALGFNELSKRTKELQERTDAQIDARRTYLETLASGTTEEIKLRREEAEQRLEVVRRLRTELRQQLDQVEDDQNFFTDIGDRLGIAGGDAESLRNNLDELNQEFTETVAEIGAYNDALKTNNIAANDAAAAEKALADQREEEARRIAQARVGAIRGAIEQRLEINRLIDEGNVEGVEGVIQQLNNQLAVAEEYKAFLEGVNDIPEDIRVDELNRVQTEIAALNGLYLQTIGSVDDAKEQAAALEATAEAFADATQKVLSAMSGTDAIQARIEQLDKQVQAEIALVNFQRTATVPAVLSRIQALETERDAISSIIPELEGLAETSPEAATALANTRDRIEDIGKQLTQLGVIGGEAIAKATSKLTDDLADIAAQRDAAIAKIQSDAARKQRELFIDLNKSLAGLDSQTREKRLEAQQDYAEESADIEKELAKTRLEIEQRSQRSLQQAIGDRDALAAFQAKQQREEDLKEADDAAKEQREELKDNYDKQLKIITQELDKQQRTLRDRYNAQLRDLNTATQNAIYQEQSKAQKEMQVRQQSYQTEISTLQRHMSAYNTTLGNGLQAALATVTNWVNGVNRAVTGLQTQSLSSLGGGLAGLATFQQSSGTFSASQERQISGIAQITFNDILKAAS